MAYKIISSDVRGEILATMVQYDCCAEPVEVIHFQPKSSEEVIQNIGNREETEVAKASSAETNQAIKAELDNVVNVKSDSIMSVLMAAKNINIEKLG